jgi:hypothetical protein
MSMSRKDFVTIAAAVQALRLMYPTADAQKALDGLVAQFCRDFAEANPHFDAARFRKACEVPS